MTRVPAGRVVLSDRRLQRSWTVEVVAFELATCQLTQAEYARVAEQWPSAARGASLPVDSVSWWDAVQWCNAASEQQGLEPAYRLDDADGIEPVTGADGYRLPTEAEWEHACRAGTTGPRYGELDDIAWHRGNSGEQSRPVGGRQPNLWGLHDLLGNVWEWCWDVYDEQVYGSYRVLRGGGWFDEHWSCRASVRRRSHPSLRIDDVGFRVARSIRAG